MLKQLLTISWFVLLLSLISCPGSAAKENKQRIISNGQRTADQKQKFFPDDPIWVDLDQISIPRPKEIELSQFYDFAENTFAPPKSDPDQRAQNINTLGEVPNSSWFTNRIGRYPMTLDELTRGPNQGDGPDISQPWIIIRAKTQGITPGFTIRDSRGDIYFIKFDPLKYPQMSTSADVISTKFFYAFGYNVPENYLTFVRRDQLKIGSDTTVTNRSGNKRKMTEDDLDTLLKKAPKRPDGSMQVIASLRLPGEPLGPFKYRGTRSDNPNDIFPHEDRRELRGLRVFSAWLNHDDARSINTLDMYVTEADRSYVKHYLIDFGSTLGSGSIKPQDPRSGNEYYFEGMPALKSALTLGLWDRSWRYVKYPDYPAVGRFESSYFQPERWKPEYPNPAFDKMLPDDAFWATRIVMRFTDEMVRAIVRTGQISDPEAENYLGETLIQRRDKITRHYLSQINPLDDFRLNNTRASLTLDFKNLGVEAGISPVNSYQYQWFRFDNQQNSLDPLGEIQSISFPSLPVPQDASPYLMVRIQTLSPNQANWKKKVEVFIHNRVLSSSKEGLEKSIVGIEREN